MTDLRQQTIDTYNKSAKALAEYFRGIGSRVADIDTAFALAGEPKNARVVEIGCGDGRDAQELVKRAGWFLGFDISEELVKLAQQQVPTGKFEVADAVKFSFPENLDIVFAFASLLHLDKSEIQQVLQTVCKALRPGGVFYISLKYADKYLEKLKEDAYGRRLFYLYNPIEVEVLAGNDYKNIFQDSQKIGNTDWFTLALMKRKRS